MKKIYPAMIVMALASCTSVDLPISEESPPLSKPLVLADGQSRNHFGAQQKINHLRKLLRQHPDDIGTLLDMAKRLRLSGDAAEALGILEVKSQAYRKNPGFLAEFGKTALATGDAHKAITLIKSAVENGGKIWQNYSALGIAHDFERSHNQANKAYDTALELSPGNPTVINNKAVSALLDGNADEAIAMLEKLSATSTRKPLTRRNLALFKDIRDRLGKCPNNQLQCRETIIEEVGTAIYGIAKVKTSPTLAETSTVRNIIEKLNSALPTSAIDINVNFEFASAVLTAQAKDELGSLGQALTSKELAGRRFLVEGHTDAVGSDGYNQVLSEDRAKSVKDYLVATFHMDPSDIKTAGYGESHLIDPSNPLSGINRRVRISVISGN